MRDQLSRSPMTHKAGHTALSIGLRDDVANYLACQPRHHCDEHSNNDQFRFRLARMNGERNPYKELIPNRYHSTVYSFVEDAANGQGPLTVQLLGGLGDQLEMLSLVLPWGNRHGVPLKLVAHDEKYRLFEPLLPNHASIEPFDPSTCPEESQGMAIRMGVFEHDPSSTYTSWIHNERNTPDPSQFVCCWRAVGYDNLVSAHSRSVPFHLVHSFYQRLINSKPEIQIVDITAWRSWEAKQFKQLGVHIQNPVHLGLTGLIQLCSTRRVISIDTALIHLCAAMGHAADLLLPFFPDERWFELAQAQHSYSKNLTFHHSPHFGSWSSVMASLC